MLTFVATLVLASAPLTPGKVYAMPKPGRFDYMNVDAKYHRVFATHEGAETLAVLDLKTGKAIEIPTGVVNGVQISDKLSRVFVAGQGKVLLALDRKTLKIVAKAPLEDVGDDIALDTKRGTVMVCHDDGTEDWVFDAKTLKPLGKVAVAGAPEFLVYNAKLDRFYQNVKKPNVLQVINPATKKVVATWRTEPMTGPHGLAIDEKTGRAFSAGKNGKLAVFDLKTGKLIVMVSISKGTDQIAMDHSRGLIYCPGNGKLSIVKETPSGAKFVADVPVPKGVHTLAVDPSTHDVWVCYGSDSEAHFMQLKAAK